MQPGIKTSEFKLTLLKALVGPVLAILAATGVLAPDAQTELQQHITSILSSIVAVVGLVMSGKAVKSYNEGRASIKMNQVAAGGPPQDLLDRIGFDVPEPEEEWVEYEDEEDKVVDPGFGNPPVQVPSNWPVAGHVLNPIWTVSNTNTPIGFNNE